MPTSNAVITHTYDAIKLQSRVEQPVWENQDHFLAEERYQQQLVKGLLPLILEHTEFTEEESLDRPTKVLTDKIFIGVKR